MSALKLQWLVLTLSCVGICTGLQGQLSQPAQILVGDPEHQAELPAFENSYPYRYWDKGYLITHAFEDMGTKKPAAVLYDRDGHFAREAIVAFKDAESTAVEDAAASSSGKLILSVGTDQAGVISNYIAEVDSGGHLGRMVRTNPFVPVHICVDDDGTVWGYGFQRAEDGNAVDGAAVLRQYSFEKGQVQALLKVSRHPGWRLTQGRYPEEVDLRCNSKQVGLFNGTASEWIEVSLATNALKVYKINPLPSPKEMRITGFALTESGDVFVSFHCRVCKPPRSGLFKLALDSSGAGSWVPLQNSVGPYLHGGLIERLLGADGDDLVYTVDQNGTTNWSSYK
jgi:hypothetical protein